MMEIIEVLKDAISTVTISDMFWALIDNIPYILIGCLIYYILHHRR